MKTLYVLSFPICRKLKNNHKNNMIKLHFNSLAFRFDQIRYTTMFVLFFFIKIRYLLGV